MPDPYIVLIGAGSAGIGLDTLCDLFAHREELTGATIGLVDVDAPALAKVERLAQRLNAASGAPFTIQASTDRRALLPGADFVVIAVEVNRLPLWRLDWEIPRRHGVRHILGENGGPGGLLHALRTVPLVLEIARDIEALCPHALVINFTNPLSRVCLALTRYTRLRVVGLCHQIGAGLANVAQTLDLDETEIDLQAVGINHFTWITALRHRQSGADLYPAFRTRLALRPPAFEPLSRRLFDAFGLFPAAGDDHLGERSVGPGKLTPWPRTRPPPPSQPSFAASRASRKPRPRPWKKPWTMMRRWTHCWRIVRTNGSFPSSAACCTTATRSKWPST